MKSQRGQALVETALILPILMLILFGITDLGRAFHAQLTLDHAGREGARLAAVGRDIGEIETKIKKATSSLNKSDFDYEIKFIPIEDRPGERDVEISLLYSIELLTPFLGLLIDNPITLENKTVMRVE